MCLKTDLRVICVAVFLSFVRCLDSEDVTNQLSLLLTDLDYINEFYYLIEQIMSVSGILYRYPNWDTNDFTDG